MRLDTTLRTKAVAYSLMASLLQDGAVGHLKEIKLNRYARELGSGYHYLWQMLQLFERLGYVELGTKRRRNGRMQIMVRVLEPPKEDEAA